MFPSDYFIAMINDEVVLLLTVVLSEKVVLKKCFFFTPFPIGSTTLRILPSKLKRRAAGFRLAGRTSRPRAGVHARRHAEAPAGTVAHRDVLAFFSLRGRDLSDIDWQLRVGEGRQRIQMSAAGTLSLL